MSIDATELASFVQFADTTAYVQVAAITFLAYDYALTFADEVRVVWSSRISLVKMLFFLNRLLGFVSPVLELFLLHGKARPASCKDIPIALTFVDYTVLAISQLMLSVRVYAIWNLNKKVLACLAMLFVPGFVIVAYLSAATTSVITASNVPGLDGIDCLVQIGKNQQWITFVIILIQETSLVCLVLLRSFLTMRDCGDHTLRGIYRLIVKDNIGYFLCASLLALGDLCIFHFSQSTQLVTNFNTFYLGLQSIICARLFLRLRVAAHKQVESAGSLSTWRARTAGPPTTSDKDDV